MDQPQIVICSDCCTSQFRAPGSMGCMACGALWTPYGPAFPMTTPAELTSHMVECGVPDDLMLIGVDRAIATYPYPSMRLPAYHHVAQIAS